MSRWMSNARKVWKAYVLERGRWTINGSTRLVWTSNGRAPVVLSEVTKYLSCQSIDVVGKNIDLKEELV